MAGAFDCDLRLARPDWPRSPPAIPSLFSRAVDLPLSGLARPAPVVRRPLESLSNPYPSTCSRLCNHPVDAEYRDVLRRAAAREANLVNAQKLYCNSQNHIRIYSRRNMTPPMWFLLRSTFKMWSRLPIGKLLEATATLCVSLCRRRPRRSLREFESRLWKGSSWSQMATDDRSRGSGRRGRISSQREARKVESKNLVRSERKKNVGV